MEVLTPPAAAGEGVLRDSVVRRLAPEPLGWRPTTLEVTLCRYRCTGCGHVWRQDTTKAAEPQARGVWQTPPSDLRLRRQLRET